MILVILQPFSSSISPTPRMACTIRKKSEIMPTESKVKASLSYFKGYKISGWPKSEKT